MSSKEQLSDYNKRLKSELRTKTEQCEKIAHDNLSLLNTVNRMSDVITERDVRIKNLLNIVNRKSLWRRIFPMK